MDWNRQSGSTLPVREVEGGKIGVSVIMKLRYFKLPCVAVMLIKRPMVARKRKENERDN